MWHKIETKEDVILFLNLVSSFHDSCIKEIHYVSGAYVDKNIQMLPINDKRTLTLVIQRQHKNNTTIEMEFGELKFLNLFPTDTLFTCEILEASLFMKDEYIYWCDQKISDTLDFSMAEHTVICASTLRWRSID